MMAGNKMFEDFSLDCHIKDKTAKRTNFSKFPVGGWVGGWVMVGNQSYGQSKNSLKVS